MIAEPMDVLQQFPVRKSKKQKRAFRASLKPFLQSLGYEMKEEKGSFGAVNVVFGDPEQAKYLVTAHYDTCAGMPFPNLITPCNFWGFLGYQILILAIMFGAIILVGVILELFFHNTSITYWGSYMSLWCLLILMMFGPANPSNANDNTSGVVTVLEIARGLPEELQSDVCFVLFDLEEAGLIGSSSYSSAHKKACRQQIVLNLDCVGDGDEIVFFPTGKMRRDNAKMSWLRNAVCQQENKHIAIRERGFSYYPSDQAHFPYGVGIAALLRSKWAGLYLDKIHTNKDTVLDKNNIALLSDTLIRCMNMKIGE